MITGAGQPMGSPPFISTTLSNSLSICLVFMSFLLMVPANAPHKRLAMERSGIASPS
jgi:hypothetical protein